MERSLTNEEKKMILETIHANMQEDDRYPHEVINSTYGGDEEAYLRVMGYYYGILKK